MALVCSWWFILRQEEEQAQISTWGPALLPPPPPRSHSTLEAYTCRCTSSLSSGTSLFTSWPRAGLLKVTLSSSLRARGWTEASIRFMFT